MAQNKGGEMSIPRIILDSEPSIDKWSILLGYRGSISHGTYVPNKEPNSIDDKDAIGICIPPMEYYYGLKTFGSRGTKEIKEGEWDIVVFELTKAIRLLEGGNPNLLSILWLSEQYYMKITPAGQLLLDNRNLFVGKHVYHSFVGYAHGQLHRMTHSTCQGYMGEKRKKLVEKFGYDTKNAAHLIRLLRMGIEFLNDGELHVLREDAQQLLEIKRGEWSLEKVKAEAERLFIAAETAYTLSKLPVKPDHEKINELCVTIARYFERNRE
jgi:predicted nucleotidyltransferase